MSVAEEICDWHRRVELLAPAGRWDAFEAVLEAGADAVYLGAKQFSMRRHRSDFHFTQEQLGRATETAHAAGRRLYVTVNAMLGESELPDVRRLLRSLDEMQVDAVIVQDLAVLQLARETGLGVPLHASTMMNVHHAEHARALKQAGVTRVITSRDISLQTIGEIGRSAEVEVECFVHGDMCVCQSGQCTMSGILFGKSANRGECMKPCRWRYELVRMGSTEVLGSVEEGHLLAIKDLCLIQHIPEIIQAGICSMKIEGRMRDAEYLGRLVGLYRHAIDQYYASPPSFQMRVEAAEELHRLRVRQTSTLAVLGGMSHRGCFDITGTREPLFLSDGAVEGEAETLSAGDPAHVPENAATVDLAVCVADLASARAAMAAGAQRIYWAAERSRLRPDADYVRELVELTGEAAERRVAVGIRTPRVTTSREWAETQWLLRRFNEPAYVLVHHLGLRRTAVELCPQSHIIADFGFNALNSAAVAFLVAHGFSQVCAAPEAGYDDVADLASATGRVLELLAHGPAVGMLLDHCLIAMHGSPSGGRDGCRGPCRHVGFALRDRTGTTRPIVADQYCRNHLLTAHDTGILPHLPKFLFPAVRSLRIEAQDYSPELVGLITDAYRRRLRGLAAGDGMTGWQDAWAQIQQESPLPIHLGAFARSVPRTRGTAQVMKEARLS